MTSHKMCASNLLATGMACALLVAFPNSAQAKDVTVLGQVPVDQLTVTVSYADLDLASGDGIAELSTRVRGAVAEVCQPLDQRHSFLEYGACKSYASNGARPQVERAIQRARQIASTGFSAIAPVAIMISAR